MAEATAAWPVGLRFKPTADELVGHHLTKKLRGEIETNCVIPELYIYNWEPSDLFILYDALSSVPSEGRECFFFCPRGCKRKTACGFWKETSSKRVVRASETGKPIGTKRILVYYEGRQPKGRKTDVALHEYNLNTDVPDREILDPVLDFSSFASPNCASLTHLQVQTASVLCHIINRKSKKARLATPSTSTDTSGPRNLNDFHNVESQEISAQASSGVTAEFPYLNGTSNFNLPNQNVAVADQQPQKSKEQSLSHDDHRHIDGPNDGNSHLPYSPNNCIDLADLFDFDESIDQNAKLE